MPTVFLWWFHRRRTQPKFSSMKSILSLSTSRILKNCIKQYPLLTSHKHSPQNSRFTAQWHEVISGCDHVMYGIAFANYNEMNSSFGHCVFFSSLSTITLSCRPSGCEEDPLRQCIVLDVSWFVACTCLSQSSSLKESSYYALILTRKQETHSLNVGLRSMQYQT